MADEADVKAPMRPDEFAGAMKKIADTVRHDQESAHVTADDLMCALLRSLGYGDGVQVFVDMEKWYA